MAEETKYQQFWSSLKSRTPKVLKQAKDRLKCVIAKNGNIHDFDEESGCKILRNDLLAHAFAEGKPEFSFKERPECAAFLLEEKVVRLKRRVK